MTRTRRLFWVALQGIPWLLATAVVVDTFVSHQRYQWDLRTYFHSLKAVEAGLDPYDRETLEQVSGIPKIERFLYPPLTLNLLRPIGALPYQVAYHAWLAVKLLFLILMFRTWRRVLLSDIRWSVLLLFALFAFSAAVSLDLRAGNVAVFESALLWFAFLAFVRKQYGLFVAFLLAASVFKWTPALFAVLLLVGADSRKYTHFLMFIAGFTVMLLANYLPDPVLFGRFMAAASSFHEPGHVANPSTLTFMEFLTSEFTRFGLSESYAHAIARTGYLAAVIVVLYTAARYALPAARSHRNLAPQYVIITACLAYSLIVPRFKLYSYILLIPVALYVIMHCYRHGAFWLLFILLCLSADPAIPGRSWVAKAWFYYPIVLVAALWLIWLDFLNSEATSRRDTRPPGRLPVAHG